MCLGSRKLILVYHSFRSENRDLQRGYVSKQRTMPIHRLREQLEWLSGFADFVRLDDILDVEATDQWKIAVTLDDGYYNNLSMALPVFAMHEVPVTWFVCTDFVERKQHIPWWDLIDYVTETCRNSRVSISTNEQHVFDLSDPDGRTSLQKHGEYWFLQCSKDVTQAVRTQLEDAAGELPKSAFATREEVVEAARSPWVELGGHTLTHPNMVHLPEERLQYEVWQSREKLEAWIGRPVDWFAYPFGGAENWDETAKRVVRDAGFDGAVTTHRAFVGQVPDRFEVPRLTVPNTTVVWKTRAWMLAPGTCRRLFCAKQALGL